MEGILSWQVSCQDAASKSWKTVVLGIPRSASSSRTVSHWSLLIAAHTGSTFSGVLLAAGLPECGSLSTDSWPSWSIVSPFYLHCTHCIVPESLLNHLHSFRGGMFKLNAKFDEDLLLYSLSHFECDGHTVHMVTQWCLPPLLTRTVKLSLFTHAHSSPLSLAARSHWCHANHSRYLNNGWTFSRQTSYVWKLFRWWMWENWQESYLKNYF